MNPEQEQKVSRISRTPISLLPVSSSQIAAIGHDPNTDTLAVRFHGKKDDDNDTGSLYHYSGVDSQLFDQFRAAESAGSFFYKNIKPNPDEFPYVRIVGTEKTEA